MREPLGALLATVLAALIAIGLGACATVPRRAEVLTIASRLLACPEASLSIRVAPLDEVCLERAHLDEGRLGPCLAWMPLEAPAGRGWLVEGCGQRDRLAPACDLSGPIVPAEHALDGTLDCAP
ncbi:MAG: hypothetical protein K1X94_18135 [Sandaracinaceae bacterium]|nr:hypothetical protein [Sandaracinaceae bacterium]